MPANDITLGDRTELLVVDVIAFVGTGRIGSIRA
jgi:hypothetical protein